MKTQTQQVRAWLWPDHVISKRASGLLREEHNVVVNSHAELLEALRGLFENCAMIHSQWGDGSNAKQADAAIAFARAAIATAEGAK